MIKKVFKYSIEASDVTGLSMPKGAEILTIQTQKGQPQLWALVDPDA